MSGQKTYKDMNLASQVIKLGADLLYGMRVGSKAYKLDLITSLQNTLKDLRKEVEKDE